MKRMTIVIDQELLAEAMRVTGLKSKSAVVAAGLTRLVRKSRCEGLMALRGKVQWEGDLDEMRRSRVFDWDLAPRFRPSEKRDDPA